MYPNHDFVLATLGFSEDDLAYNRAGKLTKSQWKTVDAYFFRYRVLSLVIISISILLGIGFFFAFVQNPKPHHYPLLAGFALTVIAVIAYWIRHYRKLHVAGVDFFDGKVSSSNERLFQLKFTRRFSGTTELRAIFIHFEDQEDGEIIEVVANNPLDFMPKQGLWRVYYNPQIMSFLSTEPLSEIKHNVLGFNFVTNA